ncbi:9016_t:CDS:2 [Funneliformis caledonium]|uniref:9016_t:CDS:1 n=1 Tax=Funneliformis caledonium TaxID=1117310 RepID=A0A9N8ZRC6_9GLOM|nr:9016_t:CDS:2 [Funneliformis caledonium]
MATSFGTLVQDYVNTVTSRQSNNEPQVSASRLEPSSSSSVNNDLNSLRPALVQSYSNRSFFRRAWDTVESIFIQKNDVNLPVYYNNYEREENEDDDTANEFIHPNPYHQPLARADAFRAPVHKRRLSAHSDELISVMPDYSSRSSSSEWPVRQTYEDWQRDQGELDIEEANIKDLISGWAMGEGRPWFD